MRFVGQLRQSRTSGINVGAESAGGRISRDKGGGQRQVLGLYYKIYQCAAHVAPDAAVIFSAGAYHGQNDYPEVVGKPFG